MQTPRNENAGTAERPLFGKEMPIDPNSKAVKEALKEGLQEWLDHQFAAFGKWTLAGLLAAAFVGAVYLALAGSGWKHP